MKKLRELYENCLGGIWLSTIFFACFNPIASWIANAVVMTIWVFPIFVKRMKEE